MADKPILFSAPMVRALLAGTKSQTRRGISLARYRGFTEFGKSDTKGYDWHLRDSGMRWHDLRHADLLARLPWHSGDRLYVREAWRTWAQYDDVSPRGLVSGTHVAYEATESPNLGNNVGRFRQGMHMPRWASRLTLTVTDVRVERLMDISAEDAIAEGVVDTGRRDGAPYSHFTVRGVPGIVIEHEPEPVYAQLWEMINGEGSWGANPWVATYTFTVHHGNIDKMGGE